ncbi:hypothetical protein [Marinobacter nauticus]|uniref:hypothetical protein n=1 Tax=Marinobacter nauticus TaxID=2743 RepID=UPI00242EA47B|nr:hypothetical protein [Marinobacter nauticus]
MSGVRYGVVGLLLAILLLLGIIISDSAKDTLIGILGSVCGLLSVVVLLTGIVLLAKSSVSIPVFLKSFLSPSLLLAAISVWNLVNAGWLPWAG